MILLPEGTDPNKQALLVNALCICHFGWRTEEEGEIYQKADAIVREHGLRVQLHAKLKNLDENKP